MANFFAPLSTHKAVLHLQNKEQTFRRKGRYKVSQQGRTAEGHL